MQFVEGQRDNFDSLGSFQDQVESSLRWYANEFPNLTTDHKIEMENIGPIASASVFFGLDIKMIASKHEDIVEAMASEESGFWTEFDGIVEGIVPNFARYIGAYLRWVYVKVEEKYWETGSRPPVGRYTPGARRRPPGTPANFGPRRGGPGGGNRFGGDRDRGPRRDGPSSGGDRGPRRDRGERNDRDRGPREDRGDRKRGPREDRDRNRDRGPAHADQEQAAMASVNEAITRMQSDTALGEIRLDPSNSFFRRLQHKKAVSEGFYSYSTGEGNDRSVVVTREKPANEGGGE